MSGKECLTLKKFEIERHTISIRSWVTVETGIENEELNVNFCQSHEFFITPL